MGGTCDCEYLFLFFFFLEVPSKLHKVIEFITKFDVQRVMYEC